MLDISTRNPYVYPELRNRSVNLCGHEISIDITGDKLDPTDFGQYVHHPSPTISLSPDIRGRILVSTFLHEGLEAIFEFYDLDLSEQAIRVLEISLIEFAKDNTELLAELARLFDEKI